MPGTNSQVLNVNKIKVFGVIGLLHGDVELVLQLADGGEAAIGTGVGGKDFGIEIIYNFVNREVMSSFATKIGV